MRASSSDRNVVCPASLLIVPERLRSESSQKAIDWGTLCHFWKETGDPYMPGASATDIRCLEKKLLMSGVEREDWWPPGPGQHEVTFAVHLKTRQLRMYDADMVVRLDDEPWANFDDWKAAFDPKEYLTGTIDWLENDWVDDLKTGHWPVDEKTSKQLLSYALVPWMQNGMSPSWHGVVSITQWERYPLAGLPHRREHEVSAYDLNEHLEDCLYAVEHPERFNPTEEGCKFCDRRAAGLCPEWANEQAAA